MNRDFKTFKKWMIATSVLSVGFLASPAWATEKPMPLASDHRIEVVAYSGSNVVPIHGTTFTTTQITFGKNEIIENVQNGDLGAWTASISHDLPNMMFIKPTVNGSNTNMTVVTNKHTYYFHLTSNAKGHGNAENSTYAVHFIYPKAQEKVLARAMQARLRQKHAEISAFKNPSAYNWDYSFSGDGRIMPIHVFDDGEFTYMQLQPNQPVPAIFAVTSSNGKESVVNDRQDGQYIVVEAVEPQFTLRLGKSQVASIFNNRLIAKLRAEKNND